MGGPADVYYRPADAEDLAEFLASLAPDEPITWIGLGSNVLVNDAGVKGVVIHTLPIRSENSEPITVINTTTDHKIIRAEAGIPCAKLSKFCIKEGVEGGEFFAGIPGTIGGALAMNAGAFGGETWPRVFQVEVMNRQGQRFIRTPSDYQIAYRSVKAKDTIQDAKSEWFIAGQFQFPCGDPTLAAKRVKELLRQRSASQPIGVFSGGSTFKNPPGDFAGRLIEASKLKGFAIGGAQISEKHANFILNLGNASARDLFNLIQHIQAAVLKDHQILLETEVRLLGF